MQLKIALLSFKTMLLEDAQTPQKSYMITPENLSRLEGLVETAEKYDLMKEIVPDSSGRTASYKNMHDYIDELKSRNTPRVASQ